MCIVSEGGRLTINASPPGWTLRSVAEREQFGVIRGKYLYNTFGAMKQEFIKLTSRSTHLSRRLNVQIKSALSCSEQIQLNILPIQAHTLADLWGSTSVPININMSTPARERLLRKLDLFRSHSRKKLRGQKYSLSIPDQRFDSHGNKLEMCLFPSRLTFIAVWVSGNHTVRNFIKLTCQKLNYNLSYICD